jgi:hypothetical protein
VPGFGVFSASMPTYRNGGDSRLLSQRIRLGVGGRGSRDEDFEEKFKWVDGCLVRDTEKCVEMLLDACNGVCLTGSLMSGLVQSPGDGL